MTKKSNKKSTKKSNKEVSTRYSIDVYALMNVVGNVEVRASSPEKAKQIAKKMAEDGDIELYPEGEVFKIKPVIEEVLDGDDNE